MLHAISSSFRLCQMLNTIGHRLLKLFVPYTINHTRHALSILSVTIIVGVMTIMADVAVAQYGGGGEMGSQMGAAARRQGKPTTGSETNWVPSISVQERYDSNVYFVQGGNLEDYVTTISPRLRMVHKGPVIDATVGGGARGEIYVKNPGLNYVGGDGNLDLNLSRVTNELVRGLGLQLSDSFFYTPQMPAFAAPTGGSELPESAVIGIQARRANSFINAGRAEVSYEISPILSLTSSYMDQRRRFGRIQPLPGGDTGDSGDISAVGFINTAFQTVTAGPALKASFLDTVTLYYLYQKGSFDQQGIESGFSTQGFMAGWTRLLTPTLTASVRGGVSVLEQNTSAFNRNDTSVQYQGSASLAWKGEKTDLMLSYSRLISPSFYVAATALMSQIVRATVSHRVTESLSISLSGSYAHSESVPDSNVIQFDSYAVTPSAQYRINRILTAHVSYSHTMFDRKYLAGQGSSFDRDMVLLRLAAEWN